MKKRVGIRVCSGDLDVKTNAKTCRAAFKVAIKTHPKSLGAIVEFTGKPLTEPRYGATEHLLKSIGLWSGPGIFTKDIT